jgi:hypothetical protein
LSSIRVFTIAALLLSPFSSPAIEVSQKPSLIKILTAWKMPTELSNLYKNYEVNSSNETLPKFLKKHIVETLPLTLEVQKALNAGTPFERGEWQDQRQLERIKSWFQLQVLTLGFYRFPSLNCSQYFQHASVWLYFLAEMAYTESDANALLIVSELRELLLKEITSAVTSQAWDACSLANSIQWWKTQRFPWPVDRVIVSEMGKHRLSAKERAWANNAAHALQKNPHQSIENWFKARNVFITPGLSPLLSAWSPSHVAKMQKEIFQHQNILLYLLAREYEKTYGSWPNSQDVLIKSHILSQKIVDPLTKQAQIIQKRQ